MHQPPHHAPQSNFDSNWKIFKIGCGIMLVFFVMSILGFYWLCDSLLDKHYEHENTLTEITGTLQSDSIIVGPLSGDTALAYQFHVSRSYFNIGPGRGRSGNHYYFIVFAPGTSFVSNGKVYQISGSQAWRIRSDKYYSATTSFECVTDEPAPEIDESLYGLNVNLDKIIDAFRNSDCDATRSPVFIGEYVYTSKDTITLKGKLLNNTIYLDQ